MVPLKFWKSIPLASEPDKKKHLPFWMLTLAALTGLTLPILVQDSMFQDAVLYSCVSRNLSEGIGSFWFLQYSELNIAGIPSFHEQPPLAFGIQSLFYKVLGDHVYVEKMYTFLMLCISSFLMVRIWHWVFKQDKTYKLFAWVPLLLWISIPVNFWSFQQNILENTMVVFLLLSVLFILKALDSERYRYPRLILGGLFIWAATLTKGFPGFFTLVTPFVYWLCTRKISFRQMAGFSILVLMVPVLLYTVLFFIPHCRESLSIYLFDRVLMRIEQMPTSTWRLKMWWRLFNELIPPLVIISVTVLTARVLKIKRSPFFYQSSSFLFLVTGLCGSLPLALILVQRGFYMAPSFPFLAIGMGIFMIPYLVPLFEKIKTGKPGFRRFTLLSFFVLSGVFIFSYSKTGGTYREFVKLHDVHETGKIVPEYSSVTVPDHGYDEYDFILQGFFIRYYHISIVPDSFKKNEFYLIDRKTKDTVPSGYKVLKTKTLRYSLCQKIPGL